jgi:hypothetical protein
MTTQDVAGSIFNQMASLRAAGVDADVDCPDEMRRLLGRLIEIAYQNGVPTVDPSGPCHPACWIPATGRCREDCP